MVHPDRRSVAVRLGMTLLVLQASCVQAQDVLEGDVRLACEAVLCLSSPVRPAQCAPSLSRYFAISYRRWRDTVRGRLNFLHLCPVQSAQLGDLEARIAHGRGTCDAATLNHQLRPDPDESRAVISDQLPYQCSAYTDQAGAAPPAVAYVGTPSRGGYWVDAANYEFEARAYAERVAREEREARTGRPD